jgi:pachytene checkpoint protein 2
MEEEPDDSKRSFGRDHVVARKQDVSTKKGTLFVEARIRDEVMNDPRLKIGVSKVKYAITLDFLNPLQF